MKIKLEHNIPMPDSHKQKYPFGKMKVGSSLFITEENPTVKTPLRSRVLNSASNYKRYHSKKGWAFKTKVMDGGVRIWRIK